MKLLGFLKRKREQELDLASEKDQGKIISHGIFFEDTNQFLKWGEPVNGLSKTIPVKEKIFADRSVFNWGGHTILKGLTLELSTTFWNHREESSYKRFTEIDFFAAGNDIANDWFKKISVHLENEFGPESKKNEAETEIYLEWVLNHTRIGLRLFEKDVYKLHFQISRI